MKPRYYASASLALGGFILVGLGFYFIFLRPPLLPEDLRFMDASLAQIQNTIPGLQLWLVRVFGVIGGYMIATGLLTIYVSITDFRIGKIAASAVVFISGLTSIGWMVVVNFLIDSDFKWLLLAFSLPWVVALLLFWISRSSSLKSE